MKQQKQQGVFLKDGKKHAILNPLQVIKVALVYDVGSNPRKLWRAHLTRLRKKVPKKIDLKTDMFLSEVVPHEDKQTVTEFRYFTPADNIRAL